MTCYKLKLNLRQAGFGLAHEWRKSLELNLRQRPGFALKGIGAGAKRCAIAARLEHRRRKHANTI